MQNHFLTTLRSLKLIDGCKSTQVYAVNPANAAAAPTSASSSCEKINLPSTFSIHSRSIRAGKEALAAVTTITRPPSSSTRRSPLGSHRPITSSPPSTHPSAPSTPSPPSPIHSAASLPPSTPMPMRPIVSYVSATSTSSSGPSSFPSVTLSSCAGPSARPVCTPPTPTTASFSPPGYGSNAGRTSSTHPHPPSPLAPPLPPSLSVPALLSSIPPPHPLPRLIPSALAVAPLLISPLPPHPPLPLAGGI